MFQKFDDLIIFTQGISMTEITREISNVVERSGMRNGHCSISSLHTSASLLVQENASPDVQSDLLSFLAKVAPRSSYYQHSDEGPDDMPAHIKTAITNTHYTLSIRDFKLVLGTWQGIFLCEFRQSSQQRKIHCHLLGE